MLLFCNPGQVKIVGSSFKHRNRIKSHSHICFEHRNPVISLKHQFSLSLPNFIQSQMNQDTDSLYHPKAGDLYFSYGSNMIREKLASRAVYTEDRITFQNVCIGYLKDWDLAFDLRGAIPSEPAMASIVPKKGAEVYGLVYEIGTETCWQRLLRSEGIMDPKKFQNSYEVIQVELECFDANTPHIKTTRTVKTLMTNPKLQIPLHLQPYVLPSKRYLNLLIQGATKEGLPSHYVEKLQNLPSARPWSSGLLTSLMMMSTAFVFLTKRKALRIVTKPLNVGSIYLYGQYERLVRMEKKNAEVQFWMLAYIMSMFVLYSLYLFPAMIVVFGTPKGRKFHKAVQKALKKKQKENEDIMKPEKTAAKVEPVSSTTSL